MNHLNIKKEDIKKERSASNDGNTKNLHSSSGSNSNNSSKSYKTRVCASPSDRSPFPTRRTQATAGSGTMVGYSSLHRSLIPTRLTG